MYRLIESRLDVKSLDSHLQHSAPSRLAWSEKPLGVPSTRHSDEFALRSPSAKRLAARSGAPSDSRKGPNRFVSGPLRRGWRPVQGCQPTVAKDRIASSRAPLRRAWRPVQGRQATVAKDQMEPGGFAPPSRYVLPTASTSVSVLSVSPWSSAHGGRQTMASLTEVSSVGGQAAPRDQPGFLRG